MTQAQTFDALAFVKAKRAAEATGFDALAFVRRKRAEERAIPAQAPAPNQTRTPREWSTSYAAFGGTQPAPSGSGLMDYGNPRAFADPQIDPNNYGPEIEQAAKSITPQEIADLRAYAKASGGNLDGQQDSDVALVAARMKLQPSGVMQRRGPSVSPVQDGGVAATSPLGQMARAIPGVKQARDFAYGAAQGGISQPGSGISSVLGTASGLAGFDNAAALFHEAANQINAQAPQGTGAAFKLGTVAGQVAPAVSAAATGGATSPLVMGLLSTASFGSGVQEYRNALLSRGEKPTPGGELAVGLAFAGVEWITEKVGLDAAMRKIPGLADSFRAFRTSPTPAMAMKLVDELAPVMLSNAGEEMSAQGGQNLIAKLKYDPNRDLTAGMGEAGLLGAAGGAMIALPGAGLNALGAGIDAYDARRRAQNPQQPASRPQSHAEAQAAPTDTTLDDAAALAEQRLNERYNPAPVGTPSPADQSASSPTEQGNGDAAPSGWKLHLNVDGQDAEQISAWLKQQNIPHKVGRSSGQVGKGMTVYVGARRDANAIGEAINSQFGTVLKDAEGEVLADDVPIAGKVWGRFDISRTDPDFHQYGAGGIPFLKRDIDPWNRRDPAIARAEADKILREKYGQFYTGEQATASVLRDLGITPEDFAQRVEQARVNQYRANPQQAYLDGKITREQLAAFLEERVAADPGEQLRRQAEARATGPQREMRRVDRNARPAVAINPNATVPQQQQRRVPDALGIEEKANKITEVIGKGWILDRRFGLMDRRQQEDMIRAGERLDPIWGETIKPEADPDVLARLGIARQPQKTPQAPNAPQGRADSLSQLLGMDSEADAQRYANSLSPSERQRLGLPQRAPEGQRQGATSQSPAAGTSSASRPESAAATQPTAPNPQGSSPSPQSTREPWQMTREEWVDGGTIGRIRFGDVDREVVESPQFDTPEEAKAWAASRGIKNPQIQSSGKRGGPKLYKASGSTSAHRDAVEAARAAGKPIPPEVLAEYGLSPNPPAKPNSSTQPQGQAAAATNKEPANGEEVKAPQAQVLNAGTAAPVSAGVVGAKTKPKPGDTARAERQAEVDAIAPDAELDATGATSTIANIANNVREGKRRYVTARDSENKRIGASMLASVRASVENGMARLREERKKWESRGRATIPQENADGTDTGSTGGVGAARVNRQGAREGQQAEDAGDPPKDEEGRGRAQGSQGQVTGASESQIRAAKFKAADDRKQQRKKDATAKGQATKAKYANNPPQFRASDIVKRIIDRAQNYPDLILDEMVQWGEDGALIPISDISTTFVGKLPTELTHEFDAEPQIRSMLRVVPTAGSIVGGNGADWLSKLGVQKYADVLRAKFYSGEGKSRMGVDGALAKLKDFVGQDDGAKFLVWLHGQFKDAGANRPDWTVAKRADLKDGSQFSINGTNFEVMPDEEGTMFLRQRGDNFEAIDAGAEFVLDALDEIPIDAGTLKQADNTGEVPDIAPEQATTEGDDADAMLGRIKEQLDRGSGRQSADMIRAFQELGSTLVPGVRLQDAEEVGRMYAMLDDGTVTLAEYTNYIDDLRKSGKVAKPEPVAPTPEQATTEKPKFSDSEGVFGQKTESITGSQTSMFGNIAPDVTPDATRYPGIRSGETVAEYEKRMGTTDTPDMFGGVEDKGDISKAKRGKPKHAIQFKNPIVGPSGAKILSYEWAWTWESVDTENDTVERRVSDWEKAELNDDTNRLIVHQFSVQQPDGNVRLVSLESALQMLGYMEKSSGKPIRSLASTLKTLAFNRMKLEQLRKVFDVFDGADKKARALPFNPKEVTTEVKDAPFTHLAKEGVKQVVWKYRGDEIHWEYWYPNSGRPIESTIKNPSQTVEDMGRGWKRDKIRDFLPDDAEGITEHDRKNASWRLGTLAAQIKDIEQRNEKLQRKIDAFDGSDGGPSSSGGDPKRPNYRPDLNDRISDTLGRWSAAARSRFDDYMGKMQRGEILGSGPPITPMLDLAAHIAFKALQSGITSKSGRKLTAFIEGRMADIRAKWPQLNVTADTLRRQVRNMLAAADDDKTKIIPAYAAARDRVERVRTKEAGKTLDNPRAVREAVASATAERPDVAAKIIDVVKKGIRQGKEAGILTATAQLQPLIDRAKRATQASRRAREMGKIEARGAVESVKAEAEARAEERRGIRAEAVRLVQDTPIAGRGKYLSAVANAKTMKDLSKVLGRLRRDLAKSVGNQFAKVAAQLKKQERTLNEDRRLEATKAWAAVAANLDTIKNHKATTEELEQAAQNIREAAEALRSIFHSQKNADKVSILGRAITAQEHRDEMVKRLEMRKQLPQSDTPGQPRDKAWLRQKFDKFLNFHSMMMALDQEFYGNGPFARAWRAMSERRTAELAKNQEFADRADKIARKYGYKGLAEFIAKSSGALGDASQQWIDVELGDFKRITLGQALDIYARDAETREKMHKRQRFTFDPEGGSGSFIINDAKIAQIENALTKQQKQLAREMNRLRSEMQFDRMNETYKTLTGNYLVQVPEHYPIRRAMKLSESPDITKGLGEWTIKKMEEAGYLKQRVGGSAPIVIGDFATTQLRQFQMAEAFIQRGTIVKYLGATLLHPDVRVPIVQRHGTKIMDRVQQTISEFSGNESPQQDRMLRKLMSNIARAQTQVNIGTWARNMATAFNVPLAIVDGKMLGVRKTLRGILKALASPRKTMQILMRHSPDLRHRWSHAGASISLMHGTDVQASTDIADTAFSDAAKGTIRQILSAIKGIGAGKFLSRTADVSRPWNQLLDAIKLGNVFDGFGAMVAYHAVRADAPASLSPNAADKWAARRAAGIFAQTANTNDLLNSNEWQVDARRSTWTAGILAFTSDIAKKQNLLYLATKRGKKATAYATAAVTLGALWSTAITAAISAAVGDDEDKIKKRAAEGMAKELVSLMPAGTLTSNVLEMVMNPRGSSGILDTPLTAVSKNVLAAVKKFADAADDGEEADVFEGAYRVLRVLNDVTGAPIGPTAGMVKRAIVNYGTE